MSLPSHATAKGATAKSTAYERLGQACESITTLGGDLMATADKIRECGAPAYTTALSVLDYELV